MGRPSSTLRKDQAERLEKFRRAPHEAAPGGYTLPQMRKAMAAPFSWQVLQRALEGRPVWELSHGYIVQWIERYLVNQTGETEDETEAKADPTRTIRGSR